MPSSPSSPVRNATLAPKDVKEWLLPEPSSIEIDETVGPDRKSTRLNSSHSQISYAVFCLKKKKYSYSFSRAATKREAPPHLSRYSFNRCFSTLLVAINIRIILTTHPTPLATERKTGRSAF